MNIKCKKCGEKNYRIYAICQKCGGDLGGGYSIILQKEGIDEPLREKAKEITEMEM